ncbi:MAG: sigma-70 family RNA polymerase sigma factor, partial [Myxococcota bacterium]|nr:sigma-70 family RNA polymerase sigma factor [Myxococcota bacterium]
MPARASVEPELLQRIHAGDRDLFSSLIQQHSRSVFFVALRFAKGDEALARDLVQKTFMKAWSARQSFRGEASFKSWLLRICSNLSINELQRAWRRQEFVPGEGLSEDFDRLSSHGESSFDQLAEREARTYLREAIDL